MRGVARRLEKLPRIRQALGHGRIGWSMAEMLSRHATPETEAALLEQAGTRSVRAMQQELTRRESTEEKAGGSGSESADDCSDGEEARATVTLTVPVEDAWALEAQRRRGDFAKRSRGPRRVGR
jgi:hypothetical protein